MLRAAVGFGNAAETTDAPGLNARGNLTPFWRTAHRLLTVGSYIDPHVSIRDQVAVRRSLNVARKSSSVILAGLGLLAMGLISASPLCFSIPRGPVNCRASFIRLVRDGQSTPEAIAHLPCASSRRYGVAVLGILNRRMSGTTLTSVVNLKG